ncbi:MAG: lipopolysaccharide biosynthesis protein [Chloroflexota bacterium]
MSELGHKTISSLSWRGISQLTSFVVRFIIGIVLARLLVPADFGLVGMVSVLTGYARVVANFGISGAVIQSKMVDDTLLSSIFWLNLGLGILLTVIFTVCAPAISLFYAEPQLALIIPLIALGFTIDTSCILHKVIYKRQVDFKIVAQSDLWGIFGSSLIAISMAYLGFGVWSLVAQVLTNSLLSSIYVWYSNRWRPKFIFKWTAIESLMGFSIGMFGVSSLNYWTNNIDNLLVGRVLGASSMGIYVRSYALMLMPISNVGTTISEVLFSSWSTVRDNNAKLRQLYLRSIGAISIIVFPLIIGLIVTCERFVRVVYGEQWIEMIPLVQIMCIASVFRLLEIFNRNIFRSKGETVQEFRLLLILRSIVIVSIIIGLRWGLLGVAIGYTISTALTFIPFFYFSTRLIELNFFDVIRCLQGATGCSFVMGVLIYLIGGIDWKLQSDAAILIFQMGVGSITYYILLYCFRISSFLDIQNAIKQNLARN